MQKIVTLTVRINAADLAEIKRGEPLIIDPGDGGSVIRVEWERGARPPAPSTESPNGASAPPPVKKPLKKCPHCDVRSTHLKTHIYKYHPDKGLSATGPKCRFCVKRFPKAFSATRHEIRTHFKEWTAAKAAKRAKEATNA